MLSLQAARSIGLTCLATSSPVELADVGRPEHNRSSECATTLFRRCKLRQFVLDAGLIRYGAGLAASYRLVGHYAAGKLKGGKSAGRLVEQATFFKPATVGQRGRIVIR